MLIVYSGLIFGCFLQWSMAAQPVNPVTVPYTTPLWPCYSVYKLPKAPAEHQFLYSNFYFHNGWSQDWGGERLDCVFIFEAPAESHLSLEFINVTLSNMNQKNCTSAVRVYNYMINGELTLANEICENTNLSQPTLTPTNSAVVTTTVTQGDFCLRVSVLQGGESQERETSTTENGTTTPTTTTTRSQHGRMSSTSHKNVTNLTTDDVYSDINEPDPDNDYYRKMTNQESPHTNTIIINSTVNNVNSPQEGKPFVPSYIPFIIPIHIKAFPNVIVASNTDNYNKSLSDSGYNNITVKNSSEGLNALNETQNLSKPDQSVEKNIQNITRETPNLVTEKESSTMLPTSINTRDSIIQNTNNLSEMRNPTEKTNYVNTSMNLETIQNETMSNGPLTSPNQDKNINLNLPSGNTNFPPANPLPPPPVQNQNLSPDIIKNTNNMLINQNVSPEFQKNIPPPQNLPPVMEMPHAEISAAIPPRPPLVEQNSPSVVQNAPIMQNPPTAQIPAQATPPAEIRNPEVSNIQQPVQNPPPGVQNPSQNTNFNNNQNFISGASKPEENNPAVPNNVNRNPVLNPNEPLITKRNIDENPTFSLSNEEFLSTNKI